MSDKRIEKRTLIEAKETDTVFACPFCHFESTWGVSVCRGCQAEVSYEDAPLSNLPAGWQLGCGWLCLLAVLLGLLEKLGVALPDWLTVTLFFAGLMWILAKHGERDPTAQQNKAVKMKVVFTRAFGY